MNDSDGRPAIVGGWYPDPTGRFELRYHNGIAWTADVSTNGLRYVDPAGTSPGAPAAAPRSVAGRNGPAVAAMVLGIVSIGIGWLPFVVVAGIVASVLAIVLGAVGRARAKRSGTGGGYAIAGLVTGIVGAFVCVGGVLFTLAFVRELDRYSNPAPHDVDLVECTLDGSTATAAGSITNLGTGPADFSLRIDFVRPGTNNPDRHVRVAVEGVEPGGTAPFSATRAVSLDEIDCVIARVDGPLPFGVDIES